MSPTLPNSSQFRWHILSLYYGISLPGPVVLFASLFSLLELSSVAWVWLCSLAGACALLAALVATKRQLSFIDPIATFLDHFSEDQVEDEGCRAGFAAALDLPRSLALASMASWIAVGGIAAAAMALRFSSFGLMESAVVITAGLIAGFVSGGILFCAVKREVEEIRVALATQISDPDVRRAQLNPISLRSKMIYGAMSMTAIPMMVALVFFSAKMGGNTEDVALRWQSGVLDAMVDRVDEQELSAVVTSVLGDKSALLAPLDVTLLDFSAPDVGGSGMLDAQLIAEIRTERPGLSFT